MRCRPHPIYPRSQRSREEMLKAMPLQQLMRFAHCNSVAARYVFSERVLGCLIAGFNCSGRSPRAAHATLAVSPPKGSSFSDV